MSHITRDDASLMPPAVLADNLRTLAAIPASFSPESATAMMRAAAERIDPPVDTADLSPSGIAYDDMTRAWRNGDYPLAWSLADTLLQYLANDGQPLTGDRQTYYVRRIHQYYAAPDPFAPWRPESWRAEPS